MNNRDRPVLWAALLLALAGSCDSVKDEDSPCLSCGPTIESVTDVNKKPLTALLIGSTQPITQEIVINGSDFWNFSCPAKDRPSQTCLSQVSVVDKDGVTVVQVDPDKILPRQITAKITVGIGLTPAKVWLKVKHAALMDPEVAAKETSWPTNPSYLDLRLANVRVTPSAVATVPLLLNELTWTDFFNYSYKTTDGATEEMRLLYVQEKDAAGKYVVHGFRLQADAARTVSLRIEMTKPAISFVRPAAANMNPIALVKMGGAQAPVLFGGGMNGVKQGIFSVIFQEDGLLGPPWGNYFSNSMVALEGIYSALATRADNGTYLLAAGDAGKVSLYNGGNPRAAFTLVGSPVMQVADWLSAARLGNDVAPGFVFRSTGSLYSLGVDAKAKPLFDSAGKALAVKGILTMGDLDGDGTDDLLCLENGKLSVQINQGSLRFGASKDLASNLAMPGVLSAGDVDGDRKVDVIVAHKAGVTVLFNDSE